MSRPLHRLAREMLTGTGLQYWPVRARGGFNAGARWTLYPWTSYWRGTHEPVVTHALLDPLGYHWEPLQLGPGGAIEGADVLLRPTGNFHFATPASLKQT